MKKIFIPLILSVFYSCQSEKIKPIVTPKNPSELSESQSNFLGDLRTNIKLFSIKKNTPSISRLSTTPDEFVQALEIGRLLESNSLISVVNVLGKEIVVNTAHERYIALACRSYFGEGDLTSIEPFSGTIMDFVNSHDSPFSNLLSSGVKTTDIDSPNRYFYELFSSILLYNINQLDTEEEVNTFTDSIISFIENEIIATEIKEELISLVRFYGADKIINIDINEPDAANNKACLVKSTTKNGKTTYSWECKGTGFECDAAKKCKEDNGDAGLYADY